MTWYATYLRSEHWAAMRKWALERAGNRCQLCNAVGHLDVHHRTYERVGREFPTDVFVLCRDCHGKHHEVFTAPTVDPRVPVPSSPMRRGSWNVLRRSFRKPVT